MADEVDGTHFVGQDSNAFGDGTTDANSKPLSVRQENRVDGNTRYLQGRGSQVAYTFFAPHGTDTGTVRPFASVSRSTLLLVPWEVYPGVQTIRVHIKAEVLNSDANTTGKVTAYLAFHDGKGESAEISKTLTETGGQTVYTLELDVSGESFERTPGYVRLDIASVNGTTGTTQSSSVASFSDYGLTYSDDGTLDGDIDAQTALTLTDDTNEFDIQSTAKIYHKSPVATSFHVSGVDGFANAESGAAVFLSAIKPLSVHIEERYDPTEGSVEYDPKSARSMQGQKPVLGKDVSGHGSNLDGRHIRPTCKAIGPKGQDTDPNRDGQGEGWPTDYRRKWSWLNTTNETETELDRQHFRLSHSNSDVRLLAYLVGFYQPNPDDLSGRTTSTQKSELLSKPEFFNLFATSSLDVDVTLQQMQSTSATSWADSTDVGSTTETIQDFPLLQAHPAEFDLANQVFWSRHPSGSTSEANEFHYVHHEGQLWPDDYRLFGPVPYTVDVPVDSSVNRGDPIRCDLDFRQFSVGPDFSDTPYPESSYTFSTFLICLQTSWWEVPSV